jgi:hypothetical protein
MAEFIAAIKGDKATIQYNAEQHTQYSLKDNLHIVAQSNEQQLQIVDLKHPEQYVNSIPVSCLIKGSHVKIHSKSSWRKLLVAITAKFISENNPAIEELRRKPLYYRKHKNGERTDDGPFLSSHKKNEKSWWVESGYAGGWINTGYNTTGIINIIRMLCLRCGVEIDSIIITVRKADNDVANPPSSSKEPIDKLAPDESTSVNNPLKVDFEHPELCAGCDPVTCVIEGISFSGRNWRDLLVAITENFLINKPQALDLYKRSVYPYGERPFLLKDKPVFSARQIENGYWIYMNLGIKDLVLTIGKLCEFCGVNLNDVHITYTPKQGKATICTTTRENNDSMRFAQQTVRDEFRAWLISHNPEWSSGTVTMHYSDAYYLYNNRRGITLEEALIAENGLQRAYDAIERFYTDNPTQTNNPSSSARSYLRSLRMLKEFLDENYPELLNANSSVVSAPGIPGNVVDVLKKNYVSGFRFDTTYIKLLSNASSVEVDTRIQAALKRIMFQRDDDIYFLLDIVADADTRKEIIDFADSYLEEYGCFEIPEFYKLYADKVNSSCIRNADDFESFYEQIGKSGVRCVQAPYIGNRIARYSNGSVWTTFNEVAAKIVTVITDEYYGSCNEDDLHTKFCAFSTDLIGKIIKQCAADELIRVEINDNVCYQTFDALGLPDNFTDVLTEVLERLDEIGLELAQNALHTAISLSLGVNFMAEFNLPDWETFRRLIAAFYKAEPRREWKSNIFGEVTA